MEANSDLKKGMGKYFGVCPSYHHSKGCRCSNCPSYPGDDRYMYCARGVAESPAEDKGCLCRDCYVYHQFALEGDKFCMRNPE
ncbi:hypothetical protein J2755_000942 [Methanohalophilus levihalophilus]|uniref:DUF2769 domain-containing protein n=1 Tax=Methanohalophilus levihalophilus TaxID=1431282 RepID=UPI001FD8CB3F|nr:DUF2769 domain-containing protein [Methanohalophilus levihalophilus]MBP2030008.1 hypothetical protein [Methanohalophilus levihalophilus]